MGLEHVLFISDFKLWANVYQLVNVTKISGFLVSFLKNSRLAIPETIFLHGNNEHELAEWQLFLSRHGTTHTTSYCLTLSGLQLCMLPPGPNRHHSLQFLLLRLSFVLSELPLDFLCNSQLVAIYFTGLERLREIEKTEFKTNKPHL